MTEKRILRRTERELNEQIERRIRGNPDLVFECIALASAKRKKAIFKNHKYSIRYELGLTVPAKFNKENASKFLSDSIKLIRCIDNILTRYSEINPREPNETIIKIKWYYLYGYTITMNPSVGEHKDEDVWVGWD